MFIAVNEDKETGTKYSDGYLFKLIKKYLETSNHPKGVYIKNIELETKSRYKRLHSMDEFINKAQTEYNDLVKKMQDTQSRNMQKLENLKQKLL